MNVFVWILPEVQFGHIKGEGGISKNYIIPKSAVSKAPSIDMRLLIWIVLRGRENDYPLAVIDVEKIEQFIEGMNTGDFFVTADISKSFRIISELQESGNWIVYGLRKQPVGLSEISTDQHNELKNLIKKNIVSRLTDIPDPVIAFPKDFTLRNKSDPVKSILYEILKRTSFSRLWASKTPYLSRPFSFATFCKLKTLIGAERAVAYESELLKLDPLLFLLSESEETHNVKESIKASPKVDVEFLPIDPTQIYARKFLSRKNGVDWETVLNKTETAEKRHQDILRNVSICLLENGYTPLQSSSIDLAIRYNDGLIIFEIKTIDENNLFGQVSKGLFQLLCYRKSLFEAKINVEKTFLIVPIIPEIARNIYLEELLNDVKIDFIYYNERGISMEGYFQYLKNKFDT